MLATKWMKLLPRNTEYYKIQSPVGLLGIVADSDSLLAVIWSATQPEEYQSLVNELTLSKKNPIIQNTILQLEEYFKGERKVFDLPVKFLGSDFQKRAWQELVKIPYGETISYGEQAVCMGDKNSSRAVGGANSKNPISIIVPCHRVIGKSGKLTGFAGGLDKKQFLLDLEQ